MLLFFLLCGRWLDSVMRDRARGGVTALLRNMGTGAMVVGADETSRWVDATALQPGMVMLVAAGERLAADGVITGGAAGNAQNERARGTKICKKAGRFSRAEAHCVGEECVRTCRSQRAPNISQKTEQNKNAHTMQTTTNEITEQNRSV